jgi:lipase maturation factor 1
VAEPTVAPTPRDPVGRLRASRAGRALWGAPAAGRDYVLTRALFLRLLGVVYLCAFASLGGQIEGLIGSHGLLPVADYLQPLEAMPLADQFMRLPTLAWFNSSDGALLAMCGGGVTLAALLIFGILPIPCLALLWLLYLSLMNIGQDFLSFQWDALLVETGFLAIFFAPAQLWPGRPAAAAPSRTVLWLLRWLLFRLMFMSGVVKLESGDPTWRGLTALDYHYWTQPLPNPAAWALAQLPALFQQFSTAMTLVIEICAPFLIFAPRRMRLLGAALLIGLQLLIYGSGNFAFFNLLTMALGVLLLDDRALRRLIPRGLRPAAQAARRASPARWLITAPLAVGILLMSLIPASSFGVPLRMPDAVYEWADRLDGFHLVNTYGLFAVMTTSRPEIIIEGSADGRTWREYEFRYKVGDVHRPPPFVAPHQPRLDWQMWFAALGPPQGNAWFEPLLRGLLQNRPEIVGLLGRNPFPAAPPRYVRAMLYSYHFTDAATLAATGDWWRRRPISVYYPQMSLTSGPPRSPGAFPRLAPP